VLIVDTYNVLHTTGVLPPHLAGLDVPSLAALVAGGRYARQKTLLVCDGPAPDESLHADSAVRSWGDERVRIVYAGAGRDADGLIEDLVQRFGGQRTITLVSSDRRLRRAANTWKCKHLSAPEFLDTLPRDYEKHAPGRGLPKRPAFATDLPLPPEVARVWMREMGVSPDGNAPPPPRAKPKSPTSSAGPARTPPAPASRDPRAWPEAISAEDLDMERWLRASGEPPKRPPEPKRRTKR